MLSIHYSTRLENLADQLLKQLDEHPPENLLAPEIFVVQNHGIGQWLSLYMAEKEGIAANLKFEFPSERIWSLIRLLDPEIPQTLPSDRGPLTWSLMHLLSKDEVLTKFEMLQRYIASTESEQAAFRRWQLCSRIADVFDQYLVYRPDMLLDWEKSNRWYPQNEAEQWQAKLWHMLIEYWQKDYNEDWLHRARLQKKLLTAIKNKTLDQDKLPGRVTVFGVSTMPPAFIKVMTELSALMDVQFYHRLVDPGVEEADTFKNSLLESLAMEEANFALQLQKCIEDTNIVPEVEIVDKQSSSVHATLFQQVKADIEHDVDPQKKCQADSSIRVQACHSAMREVEVLYDQLLSVLEENPGMTSDDILIMLPDIETYTPMIEAVFSTTDEGQPEIPYSIADRGLEGNRPAIQSFLKILELCQSRFKVTDVLDVLDTDPIRQNFDFTDEDLNRLERWIRDNRIHWGIDGDFKGDLEIPATERFTWTSGLNRMVLGYAMKPDEDHLYNEIYPYDEIETSDEAELVGKFSKLMHHFFEIYDELRQLQTPDEWSRLLSERLSLFLPDNRDYFWEISKIREVLEQLNNYTSLGGYHQDIPFQIIYSWLEERLEEEHTGGGRIGRGVTFSSLIPMRNIPFKMIGMIGMNEGSFPRTKIPIEFDLMHLEPEKSDPVRSEEDRYLFLENIFSADSHLYFSFVGQSDRQDTEFPPSVVLKQLLDYLDEYYGVETESLITKHRLQAFSPSYFKENKYFSYSDTQKNISQQLLNEETGPGSFMNVDLSEPDDDWKTLSVAELISFYQHPAKYLFQKRFGIYLGEDDRPAEDREPFVLRGLDNYQLGQELLDRYIKKKPLKEYQKNVISRDLLPEGWSGAQAYRQKMDEVHEFGTEISWILDQQPMDDREVSIEIGEFNLTGKLTDLFEDSLIKYRFGRMRPKDLIELWISHLVFQELKPDHHSGISCLVTRDKKKTVAEVRLLPVDGNIEILNELLKKYWEGLRRCTYFFPQASYAFAEEIIQKDKQPKAGLKKAFQKWKREYSSYPGEGEDPYNKLMLGNRNPLGVNDFKEMSMQFWTPFFEVLNQGEKV